MAGLTCQCGRLTIDKCPECKDAPLCADCLDEQDMCKSCRQSHGADNDDDETDDEGYEDDDDGDDYDGDDYDDEDDGE